MKPSRRLLLWVLLLGWVATPAWAAEEEEPSAMAMTGDVLVARPVGLVITTLGAAAFIVSLPFSAAGGNVSEAADTLVVGPARETFVRCLGCRSAGRRQAPPSE
ncbi:MAG: hypothetical protein CMQ43_00955 [Gammaproteobacteria bacterium]|jgi:hypothetical protein|nr:hypothetical protein [Gammaproteobacteria bacterium]